MGAGASTDHHKESGMPTKPAIQAVNRGGMVVTAGEKALLTAEERACQAAG